MSVWKEQKRREKRKEKKDKRVLRDALGPDCHVVSSPCNSASTSGISCWDRGGSLISDRGWWRWWWGGSDVTPFRLEVFFSSRAIASRQRTETPLPRKRHGTKHTHNRILGGHRPHAPCMDQCGWWDQCEEDPCDSECSYYGLVVNGVGPSQIGTSGLWGGIEWVSEWVYTEGMEFMISRETARPLLNVFQRGLLLF